MVIVGHVESGVPLPTSHIVYKTDGAVPALVAYRVCSSWKQTQTQAQANGEWRDRLRLMLIAMAQQLEIVTGVLACEAALH